MGPILLTIISLAKGFQKTLRNYKYSVLLHNNHKSLKQSNLYTFILHLRNSSCSSKHLKWVSVYLQLLDGLHSAVAKHPKYWMCQRAILQCTLESKWSGLLSPRHTWTKLHFKTCWVKPRKNSDMTIQWAASQFLAQKTFSCILLLTSMGYKSYTKGDWHRLARKFCTIVII